MTDRVSWLLGRLDDPRLAVELAACSPRELVQFDARVRTQWDVPWNVQVLQLMSGNGYMRAEAIASVSLSALTARIVVLRCVDWVPQVRDAALSRLDSCPNELLVAALPLAEQLAKERLRGGLVEQLLDARLADDDLRVAVRSPELRTRRAAWQRLAARKAMTIDELRAAAEDEDVLIRGVAARALSDSGLAHDERRALAAVLLRDRVGWIAARALEAAVALDGAEPIVAGLTARSGTVRRAARDWARVRDVDARAVYLARDDETSRVGLAEIGDARDVERFRSLLDGNRRERSSALRALARHDRPAARTAALTALRHGPANRAAADVVRDGSPSAEEIAILTEITCDQTRDEPARLRALSLLRPAAWTHFTVALESGLEPDDLRIPQGKPHPHLRPRLARQLERLPYPRGDALAFVLTTT